MSMVQRCSRCINGQAFPEDPDNPKSDIVCLQCGEWQKPPGYKPFPYISRLEDTTYKKTWDVDEDGNIYDEIDRKVEELVAAGETLTVSHVARTLHCSNGDARMSLDKMVGAGTAHTIRYGPQDRWIGYRTKA